MPAVTTTTSPVRTGILRIPLVAAVRAWFAGPPLVRPGPLHWLWRRRHTLWPIAVALTFLPLLSGVGSACTLHVIPFSPHDNGALVGFSMAFTLAAWLVGYALAAAYFSPDSERRRLLGPVRPGVYHAAQARVVGWVVVALCVAGPLISAPFGHLTSGSPIRHGAPGVALAVLALIATHLLTLTVTALDTTGGPGILRALVLPARILVARICGRLPVPDLMRGAIFIALTVGYLFFLPWGFTIGWCRDGGIAGLLGTWLISPYLAYALAASAPDSTGLLALLAINGALLVATAWRLIGFGRSMPEERAMKAWQGAELMAPGRANEVDLLSPETWRGDAADEAAAPAPTVARETEAAPRSRAHTTGLSYDTARTPEECLRVHAHAWRPRVLRAIASALRSPQAYVAFLVALPLLAYHSSRSNEVIQALAIPAILQLVVVYGYVALAMDRIRGVDRLGVLPLRWRQVAGMSDSRLLLRRLGFDLSAALTLVFLLKLGPGAVGAMVLYVVAVRLGAALWVYLTVTMQHAGLLASIAKFSVCAGGIALFLAPSFLPTLLGGKAPGGVDGGVMFLCAASVAVNLILLSLVALFRQWRRGDALALPPGSIRL